MSDSIDVHGLPALVAEGLDYFERAGDEGDRKYVAAIREHLAALRQSGEVSEVTRQLIERDQRGRAKYGTSLDRADLSLPDWLQHMAEELLDAAGYALAAKRDAMGEQQELDACCKQRDALDDECARLERTNDGLVADRRDAERYRWLRDDVTWVLTSGSDGTRISAYMMGVNVASIGPDSHEFDAAIDAALAAHDASIGK